MRLAPSSLLACGLLLAACQAAAPPAPRPPPRAKAAPRAAPPVEKLEAAPAPAEVPLPTEPPLGDVAADRAVAPSTDDAVAETDTSPGEAEAPAPRVLQLGGKPALFVWASAETKEAAQAQLAEFERMSAPWPELDGLTIAPTYPRIVEAGPSEFLVVLGTCGPDTEAVVDGALAVVRLGRPSAELRAVDHALGTRSNCPRAAGEVTVLPEILSGKLTLAAALVKRRPSALPGSELGTTWDSLTLAVLREPDGDFGEPGAIVHSGMRDARRCAEAQASDKKGTLTLVQRCVAADCSEAASVFYATRTTTWSAKGQKLVSAVKATKQAGRRCGRDDAVLDP